jgi:hypothetical protein
VVQGWGFEHGLGIGPPVQDRVYVRVAAHQCRVVSVWASLVGLSRHA